MLSASTPSSWKARNSGAAPSVNRPALWLRLPRRQISQEYSVKDIIIDKYMLSILYDAE
jgi:hypothetical protein